MCISPDAPCHLPPECCTRLSLLLSVSAPEPSDALPHTGRPGPLLPLREGITGLAGLVSCHCIQPQDPLCRCREYREPCLTQPEFRASERGEAEARQLFPNPSPGTCHCTSQGPRTVAVTRLVRGNLLHAGLSEKCVESQPSSKEPLETSEGSVWGSVFSSCRG